MAQLLQPFNARDYDPTQAGASGFPIGNHLVVISKNEVKPTKGGDSGMVVFEATIVDGEYKGVIGPIRFNLYSTSQDATNIAHRQFSALCHSLGVLNVTNLDTLHGIPFRIEVGLQKEPNEKKYTEVKKFFDANGNEPGQGGNQGGQQQQNTGFGNQGNGQQQNNGGGFGQQQNNNGQPQGQGGAFGQQSNGGNQGNNGGFNTANNIPMDNGNQGGNGGQQTNNGGGSNWSQNVGTQGQGGNTGNSAGTGNGGGWGQQRS